MPAGRCHACWALPHLLGTAMPAGHCGDAGAGGDTSWSGQQALNREGPQPSKVTLPRTLTHPQPEDQALAPPGLTGGRLPREGAIDPDLAGAGLPGLLG